MSLEEGGHFIFFKKSMKVDEMVNFVSKVLAKDILEELMFSDDKKSLF
jgi:hypothetical protein